MSRKATREKPDVVVANEPKVRSVVITAPRIATATFLIRGTTHYVQNAFSNKARQTLIKTQEAGQQDRSKKKRKPKNFKALYEAAQHRSEEGWLGIPCAAFRNAMISACRLVNFKMTIAKLTIDIDPDGWDKVDQSPLVRLKGRPKMGIHHARNADGSVDLRARPMFAPGWEASVRANWDEDHFSVDDVTNLLARVGLQVGIGEGRNDSKKSAGMGWGKFEIVAEKVRKAA